MSVRRQTLGVFALLLAAAAGCGAKGPYKVTTSNPYSGERTVYARQVKAGFTGRSAVDEVTGNTVTFGNAARVERMEPAAFESAVAAERVREAERAAEIREIHAFRREEQAKRTRIENEVWMEDWQRWHARFLADGYTDEQARFKADEIMREW